MNVSSWGITRRAAALGVLRYTRRVGTPAPPAVNWTLLATFTTTQAAPLPTSLSINIGGPLTVTDASNTISTTGERLRISGTPTVNSGVVSPIFTRQCGRAYAVSVPTRTTLTGGSARVGWAALALADSGIDYGLDYSSTTAIRIKTGATVIDTITLGAGTHEIVPVMRATGGFLFTRVSPATDYTLQWVYSSGSGSQYAKTYLQATAMNWEQDSWRVGDLGPVDPRFMTDFGLAQGYEPVGTGAVVYTTTADAWISYTLTYVTAVTDANIRFRVQPDGQQYWRVRAQPTGALTIYEFSGSNTTRANLPALFVTGTYEIRILMEGPNIKVYVNNVLQFTYASATLGQTATLSGVTNPVPSTMTNIAGWPRQTPLPATVAGPFQLQAQDASTLQAQDTTILEGL